MPADSQPHPALVRRAADELTHYAALSAYLFVCFTAVLLYKAAVLQAHGIAFSPYGFAAIKALIIAKFMLAGQMLHLGERFSRKPLVYPVLYQSLVFLAMLLVLSLVEEAARGAIRGETLTASLSQFAGGTWLQIVATCFLMWLILLPYLAFRQVARVLGEGELRRLFLVGTRPQAPAA